MSYWVRWVGWILFEPEPIGVGHHAPVSTDIEMLVWSTRFDEVGACIAKNLQPYAHLPFLSG